MFICIRHLIIYLNVISFHVLVMTTTNWVNDIDSVYIQNAYYCFIAWSWHVMQENVNRKWCHEWLAFLLSTWVTSGELETTFYCSFIEAWWLYDKRGLTLMDKLLHPSQSVGWNYLFIASAMAMQGTRASETMIFTMLYQIYSVLTH